MVKHGQYFLLPSLEKIFHDILGVNFRLTGILAWWNPFTKRKVIEGGPQKITAEESIFWQVVWANCSHQFNNPVLFSLLIFINDWPEYRRAHNCPGVKLGNHSLLIAWCTYADDLLVISNSTEGLQQFVDVIYKHAQEWKVKVMDKTKNKLN